MTTGEYIRNYRKERQLTQKQLGELTGIAEPTIRRYELGKLNPKLETLTRIADALEVKVGQLLPAGASVEYDPPERLKRKFAIEDAFSKLNEEGQQKAIERVEELTEIPKYQKQTAKPSRNE